jgi:hypothetical protein
MGLIRRTQIMRTKKYAMPGGLALLLVLLTCLAVRAQPLGFGTPPQVKEAISGVLASSNARFVFGQVSDSSKDQFMLDTFTGRLWRIGESGKLGTHLKAVLYCVEDGQCSALPGDEPVLKSESQGKGR